MPVPLSFSCYLCLNRVTCLADSREGFTLQLGKKFHLSLTLKPKVWSIPVCVVCLVNVNLFFCFSCSLKKWKLNFSEMCLPVRVKKPALN